MATKTELRAAKVAARKEWVAAVKAREAAEPHGWDRAKKHMDVVRAAKKLREAESALYAKIAEA